MESATLRDRANAYDNGRRYLPGSSPRWRSPARQHKLLFQLSDLPSTEQLVAASIRIRYTSGQAIDQSEIKVNCSTDHWSVMVWLGDHSRPGRRFATTAVFEPDNDTQGCFSPNGTLPDGWFNLALTDDLLEFMRTRPPSEVVSFHIHEKAGSSRSLKWAPVKSGDEALHLLTFHRGDHLSGDDLDRRRVEDDGSQTRSRRSKRSAESEEHVPDQGSASDESPDIDKPDDLLTPGNLSKRPQDYFARPRRFKRQAGPSPYPARRRYPVDPSTSAVKFHPASSVATLSNSQYSAAHRRRSALRPVSPTSFLDTTCQRRPLPVRFAAIGWAKMVLAPESIDIGHCFGRCPFPLSAHYNATNHAVLLQLANLYGATPFDGPCCVPDKFAPESLLLRDKFGNVAIQMLNDSVVVSCACQ